MKVSLRHVRETLAEFFGTFVFVLVLILVPVFAPNYTAFAVGFALVALIMALGGVTNAHFNPIVTLGMFISNALSMKKGYKVTNDLVRTIVYLLAQLAGSLLAAFVSIVLFIRPLSEVLTGVDIGNTVQLGNFLTQSSSDEINLIVFLVEMIFSFIFVAVIIYTVNNKKLKETKGLAIGLTLFVLVLIATAISGASFHPFRSLVTAFSGEEGLAIEVLWIYILAPTLGGSLAGLFFGLGGLISKSLNNKSNSEPKKEEKINHNHKHDHKNKKKDAKKIK